MAATPAPSDANPDHPWLDLEGGERWPLLGNCHIGRGPENDIVIDHPKASRQHAAIHAQDDTEYWLLDLGSRNGTYLNRQRLLQPTLLQDGDSLSVGGRTFGFRQPGGHRPRPSDSSAETSHSATTTDGATALDLRQHHAWLLIADIEKFTQLTHERPPEELSRSVGKWLRECRQLVATRQGRIAKYLGDGFLACWEDHPDAAGHVVATLRDLQQLRKDGSVKFRVALHFGQIAFGGNADLGEESMLGPEMNYVFRLEDLASKLDVTYCLSASANTQLGGLIPTQSISGEHELKGFANTHQCFSVADEA